MPMSLQHGGSSQESIDQSSFLKLLDPTLKHSLSTLLIESDFSNICRYDVYGMGSLLVTTDFYPAIGPSRLILDYSSRSSLPGSTDNARCAGIQVATRPSTSIARTTPANTKI